MSLPMLPNTVRDGLALLEQAGHETALVGRCVRELLSDQLPSDFEAVCRAGEAEILRLFPRAVVTGIDGRRLTLPTPAGPIDLVSLRAETSIETYLDHRDFTIHAIAYRSSLPTAERWIDPHLGRRDLDARRLCTPGSPKDRLAEDPVRALRAARLVAQLDLEIDPDLERAMPEAAAALAKVPARRRRVEIDQLLLAERAGRGLTLLRRTGLERAVAPDTGDDVALVIEQLPRDLELRLAAWLRGTRARAILRNLRCPRDRAVRIERILQLHPIDRGSAAARESRARRLARGPEHEVRGLFALREAEAHAHGDTSAGRGLDHLRRCLDRARRAERAAEERADLAMDGLAVMQHLACEPGARVGRALRFLAERVAEDPTRNEPEALRSLLDEWAEHEASG